MTLIEVMAGLVILGTLLVSILMAKSRFTRQWQEANNRMEAAVVADRLLSQWWCDVDNFPRETMGDIDGKTNWYWRTSTIANEQLENIHSQIVRLDIHHGVIRSDREPVLSVDLVLPVLKGDELDNDM